MAMAPLTFPEGYNIEAVVAHYHKRRPKKAKRGKNRPSAFMNFMYAKREEIIESLNLPDNLTISELVEAAGDSWVNLPLNEKAYYKFEAEK